MKNSFIIKSYVNILIIFSAWFCISVQAMQQDNTPDKQPLRMHIMPRKETVSEIGRSYTLKTSMVILSGGITGRIEAEIEKVTKAGIQAGFNKGIQKGINSLPRTLSKKAATDITYAAIKKAFKHATGKHLDTCPTFIKQQGKHACPAYQFMFDFAAGTIIQSAVVQPAFDKMLGSTNSTNQ